MPHCGSRAVTVSSNQAEANVLNQRLDLAGYGGQGVRAMVWVLLSQVQSGGALQLDLFDLDAGQVLATSPPLTAPTADWRLLSVLSQVPTAGALQVRIKSTGTLTAYVDDTSLALE
jgi:hypothetical protein